MLIVGMKIAGIAKDEVFIHKYHCDWSLHVKEGNSERKLHSHVDILGAIVGRMHMCIMHHV